MENTLSYLLTCNRSIQDVGNKLFTYIDIFSAVFIPKGADSTVLSFFVGGRIVKPTTGASEIIVNIMDPENVSIANVKLNGTLNEGDLELSIQFPLVQFTKPGRHYLKVKFNGNELPDENRFFIDVKKAV